MQYKYISSDNHLDLLWTPKHVWQDRVASKYKDAAPKVVETSEGTFWEWEGQVRLPSADGRDNAKHIESFLNSGIAAREGSLPPSDAGLILEHMDSAKIYSLVIFGPTRKWAISDPELLEECYRAYNDYILELNSANTDRIVGLPILPTRLPEVCAGEIYRVAKMGAKGVEFSVFDVGAPIYDPIWEPVWTAAEEVGIPICCHIGDKSGEPYPPKTRGNAKAHFSLTPFVINRAMAQIIFSGVLERHPRLNVSFGECRAGWIPFFVYWMDRQEKERPSDPEVKLSLLPSEYFKRQITVTFEDDMVAARMIKEPWSYLADSAMWAVDYPHCLASSNREAANELVKWPDLDPLMDEMFRDVDDKVRHEIVYNRAAKLFNIKGPSA